MGAGYFANSQAGHLSASLVPGPPRLRGHEVTTSRRLLDTPTRGVRAPPPACMEEAYFGARMHHAPPAPAPEAPLRAQYVPSSLAGTPYAWKPNNPESVTYGFHRKW